MSEVQPINGSWIQTIANIVNDLNIVLNELTITSTTQVVVATNVLLPQETITVVTNSNIQQPKPTITFQTNYIQPAPRVIRITNADLKTRFCGRPSSDAKYAACSRCIDEQLQANPQSRLDDCKYCKDMYEKPGEGKCVNGQMIMGRCYCNK
jgi:hypothetical protein